MLTTSSPSLILVTGSSGFIGSWVCKTLLESGYLVRGTVRSPEKGAYLQTLFGAYAEKFETVVVPDLSQPGAHDEAVKGVDGVVHVAAIASHSIADPEAIIGPAVAGTIGLLKSIETSGTSVKRVIYISSTSALLGKDQKDYVYTENHWNEKAVKVVREKGAEADGATKYAASKVLAEQALFQYAASTAAAISWDVVSLLPAWTYGPVIHEFKSFDDLNGSTKIFVSHVKTPRDISKLNDYVCDFVDVRDVAKAVVLAFKCEAAGGERFILSAGAYSFQNLYDALREGSPALEDIPVGNPGAAKSVCISLRKAEKARTVLGITFRSLSETARDTLISLSQRGL
ncbi:D-lactaldehyde dehydrogenase [Heliocybe sulcata]|uniref:D-lactaldehyde dehydrogenase n=1 Tax=Heliocybe sulcata TaxID=5364 RepID=A0A5C3MTT6_9AGAM|nr:D-lactaldehyde dehydrogenase [Heliocybe sulcata]